RYPATSARKLESGSRASSAAAPQPCARSHSSASAFSRRWAAVSLADRFGAAGFAWKIMAGQPSARARTSAVRGGARRLRARVDAADLRRRARREREAELLHHVAVAELRIDVDVPAHAVLLAALRERGPARGRDA